MNENNLSFFNWLVSLFKKPTPVVEPVDPKKTKLDEAKKKYRLEYLESEQAYYVQYFIGEQWFYLRKWEDDFTLERARGNGIRLRDPSSIDRIVELHQDWISDGHTFINFD